MSQRPWIDRKRAAAGIASLIFLSIAFVPGYLITGNYLYALEDPFLSPRYTLFCTIIAIGWVLTVFFYRFRHTYIPKLLIKYIDFFWYSVVLVTVLTVSLELSKESDLIKYRDAQRTG